MLSLVVRDDIQLEHRTHVSSQEMNPEPFVRQEFERVQPLVWTSKFFCRTRSYESKDIGFTPVITEGINLTLLDPLV